MNAICEGPAWQDCFRICSEGARPAALHPSPVDPKATARRGRGHRVNRCSGKLAADSAPLGGAEDTEQRGGSIPDLVKTSITRIPAESLSSEAWMGLLPVEDRRGLTDS